MNLTDFKLKPSATRNFHPNFVDLTRVFGHAHRLRIKGEARVILKKVKARLLSMYHDSMVRVLEAKIKKDIYA